MDAVSLPRPATPSAAMRVVSLLHVAPRAVEFHGFESHAEYVAVLAVRNAGDRLLRFRVVPPAPASPFSVLYQSQNLATTANATLLLPPGLSAKFEVVFQPPTPMTRASTTDAHSVEHAIVHDVVQLHGDDGSRVDVPLVARKAFPELELDASLCDLGLVVLSHRVAKVVRVKNSGPRAGRFDIEVVNGAGSTVGASEATICAAPTSGVLAPNESMAIKIEVVGRSLGDVRGVVRLRIREHDGANSEDGDGSDPASLGLLAPTTYVVDKIIDVRACVVEHNVELVQRHGGDKVQSLFFGSLFAGESRTIETVLRNNGPLPLTFRASLTFGGSPSSSKGKGGGEEEDREAYERQNELQVSPAEGRVDPFGEVLVTFTYHPRSVDLDSLLQLEHKSRNANQTADDDNHSGLPPATLVAFASIQCADVQGQNLTFEITGKTFMPKLVISPPSLNFGDIKSYDRADMLVAIKNVSGLPITFSIPKTAHYTVKPCAGRLEMLQSQTVVVSFVPTQLGTFKSILEVIVNKNIIGFPIVVKGTAAALGDAARHELVGGLTALPADFEPKYRFMLAEDAKRSKGKLTRKFNRMAPYELAALNGTAAIDEFEFQGTNNTHLTYCVKELASRADHREQYNNFVTELRQRREENAKKKVAALKQTVSKLRTTTTNNNGDESIELIEDVAVNLGLDRQSGVEPRMLKLPRESTRNPEPLWLENHAVGPSGKSKRHIFDENKFVKKKFKIQPTTQAEIADCALSLAFDQLEAVTCGPKTINFGKLSVNGLGKKSLSVFNGLLQNVFVQLHLGESDHIDELAAKTTLKSQVIPPQTLGGFDLVFCSSKEQFLQKQLTLTINGAHTRQVTIVAEVAPIIVVLSAAELQFEFSTTDTNPTMAMELLVTNTSDSVAPFQWKSLPPPLATKFRPDSSKSNVTSATGGTTDTAMGKSADKMMAQKPIFEIVPTAGMLAAAETLRCQVIYTPPSSASGSSSSYSLQPTSEGDSASPTQLWLASEFQLEIVGGGKAPLSCKALFAETKHQLKDKKLDFGTIAVGVEREKRLVLTNSITADQDALSQRLVFYASFDPPSVATALGLSISPTIGTILPQDSCDISVKISPHKPLILENNTATLNLQVRGGRCIKVPLLASIVIPEVKISQVGPLDFGEVVIGVSVPFVLSLENRSLITASLVMDLTSSLSDEFSISLPPKLTSNLEDVSSVFIPLLMPPRASTVASLAAANDPAYDDADSSCSKWQLCVPANTSVSFHLNFKPRSPGKHDAILPIQFAGLSHAASGIARPESITRRILATAIAPRLLFSPCAVIEFHRCVITREGIRKVPYTKTLQLTNKDEQGRTIRWQIDTSKFKAAAAAVATLAASKRSGSASSQSTIAFHIAPEKGELAPGEEVKVRVSFLPMEAVEYVEEEVPLLVDDKFYVNLSVSGIGIHPHLSFSENKIVLPTVPLGIPSVSRFFIQSTGYDHLELAFRVPLDVSKAPITLQFPKGKILSMACPKIPCEVRFLSKKSVAFNARIEFFDTDGNVFYLPIAGCTENCLFTNHDFVRAHSERRIDDHGDIEAAKVELPQSTFCYYTHPTNKFPVYLLTTKQSEAELAKQKTQLVKEKGAETSSGGGTAASGPSQALPTTGFVDVDASGFQTAFENRQGGGARLGIPADPSFGDREVKFFTQYLNANFLKSPISRFPHDLADTFGKPLYEFLDMVCTKKPPANAIAGSSVMDKSKTSKASTSSNSGPSKRELLAQYISQYTELLKFLKSYGAMVHDVLPEYLLSQDLYVRACEDPRADPAILSSTALLQMKFVQRRHVLQTEWVNVSTAAWMKVLYQVVKCFLLYRITQKSYQQTQHVAQGTQIGITQPPPAPTQQQPAKRKATGAQPQMLDQDRGQVSRACQGSNVYSEAEMVLIQWICDHVRSKLAVSAPSALAAFSPETQLLDLLRDLLDGKFLFHVLASHIPTLSLESSEYRGLRIRGGTTLASTATQIQQNAPVLLHALRCFGIDFGIDDKTFLVAMNARELLLLLLHLYQMLPQFIPKTTIEFKGVLGQDMDKTIELKNPSNRAIQYHVFLDGGEESDFRIESSHVVLEPGKKVGFVVGFRPRFSKQVAARLVFQSVRETSLNTSSGATMVFLLASNVTARKPVRVIQTDSNTYEKKLLEVVIENQFLANGNYKLTMVQMPIVASGGAATTAVVSSLVSLPSGSKAKPSTPAAKNVPPIGSFGQSLPPGRRSSTSSNSRSEHELSAEHTWCIAGQQPFYLPEYGAAGMAASPSSAIGETAASGSVIVPIGCQSSTTLKLEFLPLVPGSYKCQLLFLDENVGEFMYEIHATAHLPLSVESLEFQCELSANAGGGVGDGRGGSHFYRELMIPPRNLQLTKSLATFVDRASGLLKTKLKEGLKKCEESHHQNYLVEFNSPYFSPVFAETMISHTMGGGHGGGAKGPRKSTISTEPFTSRTEIGGMGAEGSSSSKPLEKPAKHLARLGTPRGGGGAGAMLTATPNSVLIDFQPKAAGVYTCKLLLRSHKTICGSSDWRVYDLVAKVKEPNVKTLLEFVSPARHSIVQEIPLTNPSDTPWTLKAVFEPSTSSQLGFSGPSSIQVPAKKTANYQLTFAPTWISQEKTTLVLVNPSTQQKFEFELSGYGEEPLAQEHVVLHCQARTSLLHEFTVMSFKTDPPGPQTFKIESDLRDVAGPSTITLPKAGDTAKYALTFNPIVSGVYFGSITFTNTGTNQFTWYTIEATVAPPAPEATLEMKTTVRGAMGVEISLENPLDHAVVFTIELQGSGLMGPSTFDLGAKESGVYELVYSPLAVTQGQGADESTEDGAVLFSNDEIGQFWYALKLLAEPTEPTQLDDMTCVVGDICTQPIVLHNPSEIELWLQYRVSNARNFSIKGDASASPSRKGASSKNGNTLGQSVVKLVPFGQASVVLEYSPSSLSEFETSSIVFYMANTVSDWEFRVRGKGRAPSVMKPIRVQAKVLEAVSSLFTFKNPFVDALCIDVQLLIDGIDVKTLKSSGTAPPVFDILLKKSRVTLEGFGQVQVPISFLPQFVSEAHAEIVIRGQEEYAELEWRYPIHGIAEAPLHPKSIILACQAREPLEKVIHCELLAATPGFSAQEESLAVEWEIESARFGALAAEDAIQRCLTITPLVPDRENPLTLPYLVKFEPLRPYRGSVNLLLNKKSGGRWRFDVVLEVGDPSVDDVITIESTLNQTSSVAFQLRNQFRSSAPFHAEFSAGSSSAFTVYPPEGVLPPFGSDQGMNFVVSFTPTGYGKMQSGQLVILTEEMQWTFHVKGAYPDLAASLASKTGSLSSSASRSRLGMDAHGTASPATSTSSSTRSKTSRNTSVGSGNKRL